MPDLATLTIDVNAEGGIRNLARYTKSAEGADKASQLLNKAVAGLAGAFGATVTIHKFIEETSVAQKAQAQLEAAVRSTGGAAGRSVEQMQALASSLQRVTEYSDDAVQGAQALLLTFTNIRTDVFDDATRAIVDLSTRMGGDLRGAALQVGKALQDPTEGLTALRRSGVSFSQSQQDVIKSLFETGRVAESQRLVLAELTREFGGSAAAARDTLGGALTGLKNDFGDLFELPKSQTAGFQTAINDLAAELRSLKQFLDDENVFGAITREFANLIRGIRTAGTFFSELGNQVDLTGEKISAFHEALKGLSEDGLAGWARGMDRYRKANEEYTASVQRMWGVVEEDRQRAIASRDPGISAAGAKFVAGVQGLGDPVNNAGPFGMFGSPPSAAAASAAAITFAGSVDAVSDAYAKAVSQATLAVAKQRELNGAFGSAQEVLDDINAKYALKAKLADIDREFTGKQARALKELAIAGSEAERVLRALISAREKELAVIAAGEAIWAADEARRQRGAQRQQEEKSALDAIAARRAAGQVEADKLILAQERQIQLFGKGAEETKRLTESFRQQDVASQLVAAGLDVITANDVADKFTRNQRVIDAQANATRDWADSLQTVVGVLQLLTSALGAAGSESAKMLAKAATGTQSILGGLAAANKIKDAAGNSASLGKALSGGAGGAAFTAALGSVGQIAGGALAIADALDLFGTRAKQKAREMAEAAVAFNRALEDFAIVSRTSLEESIRANNGKLTGLVKQAASASGAKFTGDIADTDALGEYIKSLQAAAAQSKLVRDALGPMVGELERLAAIAKANEVELRARNAIEIANLSQDLEVRALRAQGLTVEADALAAVNAATREAKSVHDKYRDAVLDGALATTQALEAEKRAADAAKEAGRVAEEQRRSLFDIVNSTQAFGDPRGAAQAKFDDELQRRYTDAVARGASAAELAAISVYNLAAAIDRAVQIQEADTRVRESLIGRGLTALGSTRIAEDANLASSQRQELADAVREGMTPSNLALLQFVQMVEREQLALQRRIEDGTKSIQAAAAKQIAAIDTQITAEQVRVQLSQRAFDDQITAVKAESDRQIAVLDGQRDILKGILDNARTQLKSAEEQLRVSERAYEALSSFNDSLKLSAASPLSPTQRLAEAQAQFDRLAAQAGSGSADAAAAFPAAAQAFLEASKAVNASGAGYASDFTRVQQITAALTRQFGGSLANAQGSVASLQAVVTATESQLDLLEQTRAQIEAAAAAQIAVITAAKEADKAASDALLEKLGLQKQAISDGVQKQIDALVKVETEAFQARIEAAEYYATWRQLTEAQNAAASTYYEQASAFFTANTGTTPVIVDPNTKVQTSDPEVKAVVTELRNVIAGQKEQIEELQRTLRVITAAAKENADKLDQIATGIAEGNRLVKRNADGRLVS